MNGYNPLVATTSFSGVESKPILLIIKHFYKLKAAEHEVVERLAFSALEMGWIPRVIEVDASFNYKNLAKAEQDVDAVLDIHYEYPKFFKAKSIGAFWTPTSLMKDWDLAYVWENQLSHDSLVHTDSLKTLALLDRFRPNEDFGILNHSLPGSWIQWINKADRNENPRAFYAGINWSKLSGRPGRHDELFKLLDDSNILDIYGPRRIAHVEPWKGFNSYRGEIPFDGKSILHKTRASGISLVLSAEQHLNEEIMSSRFFEALAAGNAIISDGHTFVRKNLGKNGYYLDLTRGDDYAADQLRDFVGEMSLNPTLLRSKQEYSQELFLEKFDLTKQLKKILRAKTNIVHKIKLDALVLGDNNSGLNAELKNLGFNRIENSKIRVGDLQDVLTLAQSLDLVEFCVLYSNTHILDGFLVELNNLFIAMKEKDSKFGVIPTVVLSQGAKKFSPVVIGLSDSVPLNGLVVNNNFKEPTFVSLSRKVPFLRVKEISEISYVSRFVDTYNFLQNIKVDTEHKYGYRELVRRELQGNNFRNQSDPIEEIRLMPKNRRRVLVYSLLASLPLTRPFAAIAKWFLRRKS